MGLLAGSMALVHQRSGHEGLAPAAQADPCPPDGCGGPTGPSGPSQTNSQSNQGPRTAQPQSPASPGQVPQGQTAQANPMNGSMQPGNLGSQQSSGGLNAGTNADPSGPNPNGAAPTFAANQGPFPNDPPAQPPAQEAPPAQQAPAQQPPAQQPAQQPPAQQAPEQPAQEQPAQPEQSQQGADQEQQVKDLQDQLDQMKGQKQQDMGKIRQLEDQIQKLLSAGKQKRKDDDKGQQQDQSKGQDQALAGGGDPEDGWPLLAAALGGALASVSRRKKGGQDQGPDAQALQGDATEALTGAPGDAMSAVESGQDIASGASSAAQGFSQAGEAGASLASAAQSGDVNPQDVQQLVEGVAQGVQGTASAIAAGTQEAQLAENYADQGLRALEDANPQLKPQIDQMRQVLAQGQQATQAAGQVASMTSQGAGAVDQVASLGTSGGGDAPDLSGATPAAAPLDKAPGDLPTTSDTGDDSTPNADSSTSTTSPAAPLSSDSPTDTSNVVEPEKSQPTFGDIGLPGKYEQNKADLNTQIPGFPQIVSGDLRAGPEAHLLDPSADANSNSSYKAVDWPKPAHPDSRALPTGMGYGADGHPLTATSFPVDKSTLPLDQQDVGEFASDTTSVYDMISGQPQFLGLLKTADGDNISQGSLTYDRQLRKMVVVGNTGLGSGDGRAVWEADAQPGDPASKWINKLKLVDGPVPFTGDGGDRENLIYQMKNGDWLLLDAKNGMGVRGFLSSDPSNILSQGAKANISIDPRQDQLPPLPKGEFPDVVSWNLQGAYGASIADDHTASGEDGYIVARISYWLRPEGPGGTLFLNPDGTVPYFPITVLQRVGINQ